MVRLEIVTHSRDLMVQLTQQRGIEQLVEDNKLLRIYLQDHLAGSVAGYELARRCESNNAGTPLGEYLREFMSQLVEEQGVIEKLLDSIEAQPDRLKQMAAWIAEKVGRLKLNGQVTGYSDLSRLLELEGLCIGVEGKLSLWRSLQHISGHDPRLAVLDLDGLLERGETQRKTLEMHRREAAGVALVG